jgi:hypothetical protein
MRLGIKVCPRGVVNAYVTVAHQINRFDVSFLRKGKQPLALGFDEV